VFEDTFLFLDIADFVSQVLLCFILWDIGTKEVSEEVSDIRSRVETASFDEDAELQAQIWHMFARRRRSTTDTKTSERGVIHIANSEPALLCERLTQLKV